MPEKTGAAEKIRRNPVLTAALVGGAAAATAGAVWSARAIARRNGARSAEDLNPVMQTAVTACELAHAHSTERTADVASEAPRRQTAPTD